MQVWDMAKWHHQLPRVVAPYVRPEIVLPDVVRLVKIVIAIKRTSCTSERSLSCLHDVKTYLNATMRSARFSNIRRHDHKVFARRIHLWVSEFVWHFLFFIAFFVFFVFSSFTTAERTMSSQNIFSGNQLCEEKHFSLWRNLFSTWRIMNSDTITGRVFTSP